MLTSNAGASKVHDKVARNTMLDVIRFVILNWWKRKCTFYVHVKEQKDEVNTQNQDQRIGAIHLRSDGLDPIENFSFNISSSEETKSDDTSSSSTSASNFDVTSVTSSQEEQKEILIASCASDDDIMNCQWLPPPQKLRRQFSTGDIILSGLYQLTPSRSFSTNSVVSIDSLNASMCWDSGDDTSDNIIPNIGEYTQEPFRFLSSATSTTDDTQTNSDADHNQYFFVQHMKFLRNQTRPHHFREHSLPQRSTRNLTDPSLSDISTSKHKYK